MPMFLPAAHILDHFHIPYEFTIVSAHRTPGRLVSYARGTRARGLRVIVAGASSGVPVVGVPVKEGALDGVDSLHSIVQMPRGIPVATVATNGGMNAGLLAVRNLGAAMEEYLQGLEKEVLGKVDKLGEVGWERY
ncbi:Phosphoribosylaminoimidazole carboxylase pure domain-containing protein [Boletus coccyginus]|nr:Phosphoribosylaminoimidazole carboxylase pure domain-containing protein [Boletus coccyginus]